MSRRAATTTAGDARSQIISAAETLFAEHGSGSVSLREVNRAAGQANATAVQYHFTDRAGLLRAILAKHRPGIDVRRHALLDAYEEAGEPALRPLAAALVAPIAAKLDDPDGGRAYLRIMAEVVGRPDPKPSRSALSDPGDSLYRWRTLLEPLLDPTATQAFHLRFTAHRFAHLELGVRAASRRRRDDRLFVSHLTDVVASILATPLSPPTARLLAERDGAR